MHPTETLARRWYEEVWNQGSEAALDAMLHPNARAYDFPTPGDVTDREGFKASVRAFRETFSELRVQVDEVVTNEDSFAARWSVQARHTGPGLGFAATQLPIAMSGISMAHVRDGLIEEGWNALDLTRVIHQLQTQAVGKAIDGVL